MPENPEINLEIIKKEVKGIVINKAGKGDMKTEIVPFAFGLNSLNVIFVMNEDKKLDPIEDSIRRIKGVNSVEVTDVRRAIG